MSFKRFTPEDFLVSADSITAPCWTNNVYNLTTFFTSSTQAASSQGNYVLAVYQTASTATNAAIQFYVGYANQLGSGSTPYDANIPQYSPSSTLYGQYRNLILEDENGAFIFGDTTGSQFYIVSVERANYKQSLLPGSLNLTLRSGSNYLYLTDNSNDVSVVPYINGTRVYQILNMSIVQANNFSFEINGPYIDLGDLCNNIGSCQIVKDDNILIAFAESGSLVVCRNDILEEVVAGNSELAIKLYEDLLVGYKNNKKTAVYHSQLFTKYIVS